MKYFIAEKNLILDSTLIGFRLTPFLNYTFLVPVSVLGSPQEHYELILTVDSNCSKQLKLATELAKPTSEFCEAISSEKVLSLVANKVLSFIQNLTEEQKLTQGLEIQLKLEEFQYGESYLTIEEFVKITEIKMKAKQEFWVRTITVQ